MILVQQITREIKDALKPALWGNAEKSVFKELATGQARLYVTNNKKMLVVVRMEGRTMVVVAVAGTGLTEVRREIIDFATMSQAGAIRFHTKAPEHLVKGLRGLPIKLVELNLRRFGRDEHVYKLEIL